MKRFKGTNGLSLPVILAVAAPFFLQACGGADSSSRRDATTDLSRARLDGGVIDSTIDRAADRAPGIEVSGSSTDTGMPDLPGLRDVAVALPDTAADLPIPPAPDTGPDLPAQADVPLPGPETGSSIDAADTRAPDLPLSNDTSTADAPNLSTIDAGALDTAPFEANLPGVLTGWPTAALDFGANPCGGDAPAPMTFTLTNAGGSPVNVTRARFTGSAGYTTDAEGKSIAAGATLEVTVNAPAIPATVNIPTTYEAVLTMQTDIPGDSQHLITVTEEAQGVILAWDTVPEFGSFGLLPPGHTTDASFHVLNLGNIEAEVSLATTGQFAVSSQTPVVIGPLSASDSVVTFVPSTGGAALGTLAMSLATPVATCQPLPAALNLTGTSDNGAIALSSLSLSYASECNRASTPQTLTVTNTGTVAMTWTATLGEGAASTFTLSPATSTLTPDTANPEPSAEVTVTSAIPTSATPLADTIEIATDAVGDTTHTVVLTQTPLGDVISVTGGSSIQLGSVPIVSPALTSSPVTVTLRNDANANSAPAEVTMAMTGDAAAYFSVTPAQVSIPAGTEVEVSVTFSPGTDPALVTSGSQIDLSATLHWAVGSEPNCGAAAGDLTVKGTATLGQVSGIPGQLDFALVNCGATGLQQQITVTNSGAADYQVTGVTLENTTYYAVDHAELPKTLAEGGSMVITVTPSAIPQTLTAVPDHAQFDGKLTITTDLLGDVPHDVALLMGARGAIITNSPWPTDWSFGIAPLGESRKLYVPVINTGNVPVTAALQDMIVAPAQEGVFSLDSPATLAAASTSNIVALFQPNEAGSTFTATANLTLSVASDRVFCQSLPSGWNSTTHNIHMQGQSASAP